MLELSGAISVVNVQTEEAGFLPQLQPMADNISQTTFSRQYSHAEAVLPQSKCDNAISDAQAFIYILDVCVCESVFYVFFVNLKKGTMRCYAYICDGIILSYQVFTAGPIDRLNGYQ